MRMIYKYLHISPLAIVLLSLLPVDALAHTVRAMFLGATSDSPTEATLVMGEKVITIPLPRRYLSEEIDLPDSPSRAFILPKAPRPDEEIDPATPRVRFPEESNRSLLLFVPDKTNKVFPVRVISLNTSPEKFPAGHTIMFNLSQANIAGKFGDQQIRVAAGKRKVLKPPSSKTGGYPVQIVCKTSEDADWITICSSTWRHNPKARQLMFISPSEGRKFPRVWTVVDKPQVKD